MPPGARLVLTLPFFPFLTLQSAGREDGLNACRHILNKALEALDASVGPGAPDAIVPACNLKGQFARPHRVKIRVSLLE
jgi:hypothetical protein